MRLIIALLFVFALGTGFSIKGGDASQDKDVKKEEFKESLATKLNPKSIAAIKKILFQNVGKSKIDGQKSAEDCAAYLNRIEKLISSLENTINTSKDKEVVSSARRLIKDVVELIELQSLNWQTREGSSKLKNLADKGNPGVGYGVHFSSLTGQWDISRTWIAGHKD